MIDPGADPLLESEEKPIEHRPFAYEPVHTKFSGETILNIEDQRDWITKEGSGNVGDKSPFVKVSIQNIRLEPANRPAGRRKKEEIEKWFLPGGPRFPLVIPGNTQCAMHLDIIGRLAQMVGYHLDVVSFLQEGTYLAEDSDMTTPI